MTKFKSFIYEVMTFISMLAFLGGAFLMFVNLATMISNQGSS